MHFFHEHRIASDGARFERQVLLPRLVALCRSKGPKTPPTYVTRDTGGHHGATRIAPNQPHEITERCPIACYGERDATTNSHPYDRPSKGREFVNDGIYI